MRLISIHGYEICSNHDATIALFEDGICTACLPVERISRNKRAINEPVNLSIIEKILRHKNLKISDIDIWLVPITWNWQKYGIQENKIVIFNEKDHHLAHIAGSFYSSNFEHACCICSDGIGGNQESITLAYATRNSGIKVLKTFDFKNSLGIYYETAANLITGRSSEGKFMGLASWGNKPGLHPIKIDNNLEIITNNFDNDFCKTISESAEKIKNYWQKHYNIDNVIYGDNCILNNADFAAQVQDDLNYIIIDLLYLLKKKYPNEENLCISGGTFLNCTTNGIVDTLNIFKHIYCTPQPHDEGQAIGKALFYLETKLHQKTMCRNLSAYLGLSYDMNDIFEYINEDAISIEKYSEEKIINLLNQDEVIAWYQGESEIGPRALGHRSLIASPKNKTMLKKLSVMIKQREFYRPLAPVCIDKLYSMVFNDVNPENLTGFMLKTVKVKKEWQDKIPAVVHIDGTARPQRLEKHYNSRLYHLLERYYEETNIPCLINTSLNAKNQPIIETPKELLDFLKKNNLVHSCVFNGQYIIKLKDKECL